MRTINSREQAYNKAATNACNIARVYANEKQLGSVSKLYKISVMLLSDANFKMNAGFSNQELTDQEIDYALKNIKNV